MPCNLKTLTIGKKILETMKDGRNKKHIPEKFGIPTIHTIHYNKEQ